MPLPRKRPDPTAQGALHGVRVLDLSRLVAGNMLTHLLADHGADVIKIERANGGDDLRKWRENGLEAWWKVYCRNKRSLALDLRSDEGKDILRRLVTHAQVFVENFVPGVLEDMGFGPDVLLQLNPKLIVVRISGWGQTGPYRDKPGFGTLVEGFSGFAHLNGHPDKPPTLPPLALGDMIAGSYGAMATVIALREAERPDGKGQIIDLSLFEPIFSVISADAAKVSITGKGSMRMGNRALNTAPRNVYICKDGKYVCMSGSMQAMAERIFRTIGRPDLITDPRFVDNTTRMQNVEALDAIIGAFIADRTQAENLAIFEAADVTVGPVNSIKDAMTTDFAAGREAIIELEDREAGWVAMHNIIPRLSETPGAFRYAAPQIGEHNAEILAELAEAEQAGVRARRDAKLGRQKQPARMAARAGTATKKGR
jgi:crotonobetainyl-CoA:carnitine CoA-transferase CaiB-like acyl-CoA transferase